MNAVTTIVPAPADAATAWFCDVIAAERQALSRFLQQPLAGLPDIIDLIAGQDRPIVLLGVGKSGHVAAKLAATFSSLGTAAQFVNAAEAAHGDLGAVAPGCVVVIVSNSGSTEEIVRILPVLTARACTLVGIIGRAGSPLACAVDHLVLASVEREADHIGMAPTSSTTLHLAVGDALAVAASRMRGFTRDDFLRHHPAGLLGRQLVPVASIMRHGADIPTVDAATAFVDVLAVMSRGRLGAACVVDRGGRLIGLIVDGDVRRRLLTHAGLDATTAAQIMQLQPQVVGIAATIGDVVRMQRGDAGGWLVMPVVDAAGRLCGMIHATDLMRS